MIIFSSSHIGKCLYLGNQLNISVVFIFNATRIKNIVSLKMTGLFMNGSELLPWI